MIAPNPVKTCGYAADGKGLRQRLSHAQMNGEISDSPANSRNVVAPPISMSSSTPAQYASLVHYTQVIAVLRSLSSIKHSLEASIGAPYRAFEPENCLIVPAYASPHANLCVTTALRYCANSERSFCDRLSARRTLAPWHSYMA